MRLYKCAISTGMIPRRVLLLLYLLGYLCAAGKPSHNEPHSACYNGSIYQLYKSGKSQSESLTSCQQDGGTLASVKTKTIHCIMLDLIEEGGVTQGYIGASQYSSSEETSWLFDNSLLRDGYDNRENTANYAEGCVFFLKKSNGKYGCAIINGRNVDGHICQIESNCSSETGLSENQKECISSHSTKPTTTTPDETSMTTDNPVTSTTTVASTELTTTTTPTTTTTIKVTTTSSAETTTSAPARSTIKWTAAFTTETTAITHKPTTTKPVTSAPITATTWLATANLPASTTGSTSTATPITGIPTTTPIAITTTLTNTATVPKAPPILATTATIPITTTDAALTTMTSSPTTREASNMTTRSPRATNVASTSLSTALTMSTTTTSVQTNAAKITSITSSSQAASSTIKLTKNTRTTSKNDNTSPATSSFYQPLLVSTKISTETSSIARNTASTLGLISNTHTSAKSIVVAEEHTVSATQANYISTKPMHAITGSTTTSQSRKSAPTPPQTESANNAGKADHLFGLDNVGGTSVAITGSVLLLASIACLMCLLKRFITKRKIKKMEDLEDEGGTEVRRVESGELRNSIFGEQTTNNYDRGDNSLPGFASKQQAGIPPASLVQPDIVCNKGEHVALTNSRKRSKSFEMHSLGENQLIDITPTNVEIFITDSQPRSSISSLLDILSVQPDRTGNQIGGGRRKIRLLPKPSYAIEKFKAAAGKVSKRLI